MFFYLNLVLFILNLGLFIYILTRVKKITKIDNETKIENEKIQNENLELKSSQEEILTQIDKLENIKNNTKEHFNEVYANYVQLLENQYQEKNEEYEKLKNILDNSYQETQLLYLKELDNYKKEINKLKETKNAIIEAKLREEENKLKTEFFMLKIPEIDLKDAKILLEIENKLANPRVLKMLIWQSFYQKPMTQLCNNVVGNSIKVGIYKITNQINGKCYIGQSNDIASRFKQHAKCGLGIDAPVSNKLYADMQKYRLENFSFEIIELCSLAELNEKEKFFISYYQSDKYGYNSTIGNK